MRTKLSAFALMAAMSCGIAWAQNPFAGQTPVTVELKKSFSSSDKVGTEISVVTKSDINLGSTKLPSGSILTGHVLDATKHAKDTPDSTLVIVFDQAKPKKGDPIAITASVYKLLPADDSGQRANTSAGMRGTTNEQYTIAANRKAIDASSKGLGGMITELSPLPDMGSYIRGISMSAEPSRTYSCVLTAKDMDVSMLTGMNMVIGVAPVAK